jgi:hypothetical protein
MTIALDDNCSGCGDWFWNLAEFCDVLCFRTGAMIKFLLWCLLFFFCWPLALLALIAYPLVWLILLPFRIVGFAVEGVLELVAGIIMLPGRLLRSA